MTYEELERRANDYYAKAMLIPLDENAFRFAIDAVTEEHNAGGDEQRQIECAIKAYMAAVVAQNK